ncbi:MAG: hypothetical protein AB8G16_14765 [Gammaproteobacteria bacterium]
MIQKQETAFNVVFEGRYVAGRDPVVAQAAFAKQFGDSVAGRVFNQERTILKRDVTQEAAQQMQGLLTDVGIVVSLLPATDAKTRRRRKSGGLSIVERAAERSRARTKSGAASVADKSVRAKPVPPSVTPLVPTSAVSSEKPPATRKRSKWRLPVGVAVVMALLAPLSYVALTFIGS